MDKICPVCGKGTLTAEVIKETFTYRGETTTIPHYKVFTCSECKEQIVDSRDFKKITKLLLAFKHIVDKKLNKDE